MTEQEVDAFWLDEAVKGYLIGRAPIQCHKIARALGENQFKVRESLLRLIKEKEVIEVERRDGIYYERAHGGYSPTGGDAA